MSAGRVKFLVLGAGPAGLGAACRLDQLGRTDWLCLERDEAPGGLSRSFVDAHGFTWDLGGHVIFSRLEPFNRMLDERLPDGCHEHERRAFVRLAGCDVPYPFQNNLHHLPDSLRAECLAGLAAAAGRRDPERPANFAEWAERSFGAGVCRHFMRPYNRKLWCCEPEELAAAWVGERVARPDPAKLLESARAGRDDTSWGPNRTFRFPKAGGTGAIWSALAARLPADKVRCHAPIVGVDLAARCCRLADGGEVGYEHLVATAPLDALAAMTGEAELAAAARGLGHNCVDVFGLGLAGRPPEALADKCWMYFPDPAVPFYRLTVFSNYSPANVPAPGQSWSLLLEVAHAPDGPGGKALTGLRARVLDALRAEGLVPSGTPVLSEWHRRAAYAYPLPTLRRDAALGAIVPALEARGVWPRGRFGAWRYEVGNMDHCFVQGLEVVDRILSGKAETVLPVLGGRAG